MHRRTTALLMALVVSSVSTTALAQTTSTSSSSTTTSVVILTTTTTTPSTTSTTVVNPCTGQPCTDNPPMATLSGDAGEIRLFPFSACWRLPNPVPGQGLVTKCVAAALSLDDPVQYVVRRGETLTLRFDTNLVPTEVGLQRGDVAAATTPLTATNPTSFVADLPVGPVVLMFRTTWNQGNVDYRLKVDVRAPATASDPRPLALTG